MENNNFAIINVEYRINMMDIEEHQVAEIIPLVTTRSDQRQMLIATLCVDGHELLPCAKIIVGAGETTSELRPVRIIDPLTVNTPFTEGGYLMALAISGLITPGKPEVYESKLDIPVI